MFWCLRNKNILSFLNHTRKEIIHLLDLTCELKHAKKLGIEKTCLIGKNIALIFEKTSTRTRCSFEIAAYNQGAHITYINKTSQIGEKESIEDTAKVLSRIFDAIVYRGFSHLNIELLSKYANIPVFNALTNEFHPTQILADIFTMIENSEKKINNISYAYLGDARSNVGRSLIIIGAKLGMDVRIASPKLLWPSLDFIIACEKIAWFSGANLNFMEDPFLAVKGVDFIYTDVWVSIGESIQCWSDRIKLLMPYQVNNNLIKNSNNPIVKLMHCLPSFHNIETILSKQIINKYNYLDKGIEISEEVFKSSANIAFEQSENRMHTIKSILISSLI
ncbi:Ornithine carbamoyltransferase, catabolic [Candidatus Johnevansia muelleri]|uniref:Ornithine carbamoyltransferase n=1 Tax=Candidatus Johnevansia muelleri TaxID=1495769 RepID=A0A078KHZ2_9GAMM|nr:Ornithine carbamoyltransferase, catabolic [Candidatus Evansia muelleri]